MAAPISSGSAPAAKQEWPKAIDVIRKELKVSMALTGIKRVNEIGRHILVQ